MRPNSTTSELDQPPLSHLAIGLEHDAPTQTILHECLVRLRQAQLPRQPRVLDARPA